MKIKLPTSLLLSSFILSALTAVPSKINYQGIITDIDGSPIVSTANTITALLYATELGGAALYTQSFVGVNSDNNGMYSIQVGDGSLQSFLENNNELWLELIINEQTLSPRQKIHSVPYALVAKAAESIVPGSDADSDISTNASDIQAQDVRISTLESGSTMWTNNASNIQAHNVRINMLESGSTVWSSNASDIQAQDVRINTLESGSTMWTTNASDILTLQADVDQNESDADAAIADIKAGDTVFSGSPSFTGVKPLPSGLTDYIGNYYELQPYYTSSSDVPNYATVNVDGLLNADVINAERMLRVGNLYITENEFRSDYGQVNISDLRTNSLRVDGDIAFNGYRADFEYAGEVRVPTPDQDNEATNKAYVDAAVAANTSAIATETSARATAISDEASTARARESAEKSAIP